jgi:hypothetical protein
MSSFDQFCPRSRLRSSKSARLAESVIRWQKAPDLSQQVNVMTDAEEQKTVMVAVDNSPVGCQCKCGTELWQVCALPAFALHAFIENKDDYIAAHKCYTQLVGLRESVPVGCRPRATAGCDAPTPVVFLGPETVLNTQCSLERPSLFYQNHTDACCDQQCGVASPSQVLPVAQVNSTQ